MPGGATPRSPRPDAAAEGPESAAKKAEWLRTRQVLAQRERALESAARVRATGGLEAELRPLGQEALRLENERECLSTQLVASLHEAQTLLARMCGLLDDVQPGDRYIDQLARVMSAGEAAIAGTKAEQRREFDLLMRQERALDRELELFVQRSTGPAWDTAPPVPARAASPRGPPRLAAAQPDSAEAGGLHPDVAAYEAFEEKHGPLGGWHPDDHAQWCAILKACGQEYDTAVEVAVGRLAGVSRDAVVAHARWHAEHEDLSYRKRHALQLWRIRRIEEKEARAAADEAAAAKPALSGTAAASALEEQERRALEKAAVREWRAQQRAEAEERARAAREAERRRRREEAERLRERQHSNQRLLEAAAAERAARARAERAARVAAGDVGEAADSPPRPATAPEVLLKRHRENINRALRRREQVEGLRGPSLGERLEKQRAEMGPRVEAKRDSARVLRPTSAATARREAGREAVTVGNIRHVQHRIVPAWRQKAW
ncbi:unnamed protein product [Pedinophyceae sp. YPF-701]|nr:unnamed protein product [Pedinophyceae sp. YPF-701]